MGPTWGPSGVVRTQVGPMLVPWTLLSGILQQSFTVGSSDGVDMYSVPHPVSNLSQTYRSSTLESEDGPARCDPNVLRLMLDNVACLALTRKTETHGELVSDGATNPIRWDGDSTLISKWMDGWRWMDVDGLMDGWMLYYVLWFGTIECYPPGLPGYYHNARRWSHKYIDELIS